MRRLQGLAAALVEKGVHLIIYGDPRHPEVDGVLGWAGGKADIVASAEDLNSLEIRSPAALLAQTTGDGEIYERIREAFLNRVPGGEVFDTLCPETRLRQQEALRLAEEVDAMVVVGGAASANTGALFGICRRLKPTCRVAGAGELSEDFLREHRVIGVTAGASTPRWTIKEVVERMENENFEVEPEIEEEEQIAYENEMKVVQVGEQVSGKVVRATPDEAFVDLGYKTEALLPVAEIYLPEGETLPERLPPGAELEVTVIDVDEQEGRVIVSHKRLAREKRWQELEQAVENETTEEGKVKQVVPAGLVVDLGAGIEGFMPGSLVELRYVPDFKHFLGERVEFKVIEYKREKEKVILSRKKVLEAETARKKEEIFRSLEVGSIVPGIVRRLTDFGAFVDVGGIDGLIHVSELSWERVAHSQEVLKVGDEIKVKVLDINPEKERISLSLRQTRDDPWTRAMQELKSNRVMKGKITRLVNFGAFVELRPGVEGLVHISQIADYHVKHPSEVLHEGEEVEVKILELKPEAKRISLSIKEARGTLKAKNGPTESGADNSNITLGDVFGGLFEQEAGTAGEKEDDHHGSAPPPEEDEALKEGDQG